MTKDEFKSRTKEFALNIINLTDEIAVTQKSRVMVNQILRSATSVAANYRAACRARSTAEFLAKMGVVEEESDETLFWLELLVESEILPQSRLESLMKESNEITAIVVSSINTAKKNRMK